MEIKKNEPKDEDEIKDNYDFDPENEIKVDIKLYEQVSSTIFDCLKNVIVRKEIVRDEQILKILQLQISNLFFLEKELSELKVKNYAKEFLQIISNLVNQNLTVAKSEPKTAIEILEERNLLIVSITNLCKNVERETLEKIRVITENSFTELNDEIQAINDFSANDTVSTTSQKQENNINNAFLGNQNNSDSRLVGNPNLNNLDNANLANLSKLGVLPQHPATNPKFYPYLTKPKAIPICKKIMAGFLLTTALLFFITYILTYFVKGSINIISGEPATSFVLGQITSSWLSIITGGVIFGVCIYQFLKPPRFNRDVYRISYFLLVILVLFLLFLVVNTIFAITDSALTNILKGFLKDKQVLAPDALNNLKNLPNFNIYKIFSFIAVGSAALPMMLLIVMCIINPRIDRNKIMRANNEYQNAITSALSGKSYEIDPSLFDETLENQENSKNKIGHKFWKNSDLFK